MESGFDKSGLAWARATGLGNQPDWPGLHARLTAAHAARRALLEAWPAASRGSFAPAAADFLAVSRESLASVNRNDLGDGKPAGHMTGPASASGDRGQA